MNSGTINHDLIIKYSLAFQWLLIIAFSYFLLRPYLPEIVSRIENIWGIKLRPQVLYQPDDDGELKQATEKAESDSTDFDLESLQGRARLIEDNFQIRWSLEKTYRFAYGTQISALSLLIYKGKLSINELKPYFDKHISVANVPHPNIYVWLQYLTNHGLAEIVEDQVSITNVGRLFSEYLTAEGINDPNLKPN